MSLDNADELEKRDCLIRTYSVRTKPEFNRSPK